MSLSVNGPNIDETKLRILAEGVWQWIAKRRSRLSFAGLLLLSNKKTSPSVTVNGVFQRDAGWIHQDSNSDTQYG